MTIGLVTPYFPDKQTIDSGIANHYLLLAESLAELKHKVIVMHVRPSYAAEETFELEYTLGNVRVLTFRVALSEPAEKILGKNWAARDFALKIKCMIRTGEILKNSILKYGIQVVETSSYFSLCYFFLKKNRPVPVAVRVSTTFSQIMNDYYPFRSRLLQLIGRMEIQMLKKSQFLLTHAHSHAQELQALYGIDSAAFTIIPHGIRVPPLPCTGTSEHRPVKVLFVGRLEFRKGIDVLLDAIPVILKQNTGVHFEIIGNDPGKAYEKQFLAKNNAETSQKVTFMGKTSQDALKKAYGECDIFVAPSRYESFGLIFIEAMSYGKPVVGCDVGGVSQIIRHGANGLFAENGNPESLAERIEQLIKDPGLRMAMGVNARKTVEDQFTGRQLAESSAIYYASLISTTRD
ncbi:glycosyltransferase family 4 protein [Mucilaginibacter sp. BJC16-A38]|uniref:glycosyltransferase family 4 protein n=1 Tax=Mucilaginibacter phenanthrenivorans TaxID=1234842 RepID=UPI002157A95D|nr:glycosyltransferase family 4 protein [Mucilaginibacter phenanthrenivorans]MCR8560181.1 glycosyltransferase family 4 protein [Mucilaginibacter phenanthrenivorans]